MGTKLLLYVLHFDKGRSGDRPAQENRTPSRQAWKLTQQGTKAIRHKPLYQVLIRCR